MSLDATHIDHGPYISPTLVEIRNQWSVCLKEQWPDLITWQGGSRKLDTSAEWCEKVLETWNGCNRHSWNTWSFDTKKNAEKFITYYNIACPQ